jgi:uncharacterized protein YaaQ
MIEPKVGEVYVNRRHSEIEYEITRVEGDKVFLKTGNTTFDAYTEALNRVATLKIENTISKPMLHCVHRNVQSDRFFSAKIYKTCKDCGANLN